MISDAEAAAQAASGNGERSEGDAEDDALIRSLQSAEDAAKAAKSAKEEAPPRPKLTRITAAAKAAEDRANKDDAPF
jgi:hypothetical protein